jgi:F0F1-type ATP synthase assembly protein I
MQYLILKYLVTAGLVVVVSEFAKRSDKLGGLIAALPLVTLLTLIWLFLEKQPISKIANHAYYTFWFVIPTLPMLLLFPHLLTKYHFWTALSISILFTILVFIVYTEVLKHFGINLL